VKNCICSIPLNVFNNVCGVCLLPLQDGKKNNIQFGMPVSKDEQIKSLQSQLTEARERLRVVVDALKFYAAQTGESEWDGCKFLTFDKFGGLCEDISGAYVANQALAQIQEPNGKKGG